MYIFIPILILEGIYDIKKRSICIPLVIISYLCAIFYTPSVPEGLIGFAIAFLSFVLVALTGKIGGGDAIIAGSIGLIYGPVAMLYSMIFAMVPAAIYLLIKGKNKSIPLIPFMGFGVIIQFIISNVF